MKIVHAADIHLGRRRLDGRLPDKDFADAFGFVASKAIEEKADVFLIAGDLFDRPQVEPPHLRQAQQVLLKLKQAGVPVIAIEGNHDKASPNSEAPTWLQYLAEDELLTLLQTRFDKTGPLLTKWESPRQGGAWIDLGGVRFVGTGYYGAATPHRINGIATQLEPQRTHVVLLHAGPEKYFGEGGGFSSADLKTLREKVCYLALGHLHKPQLHEGWACNPGSPENCDLREAEYGFGPNGKPLPRGFAVVEIDPMRRDRPLSVEIRNNERRPCERLTMDCAIFREQPRDADALIDAAAQLIRKRKLRAETVVELDLRGPLDLKRMMLDLPTLCAAIEKAADVFAVTFDLRNLNAEIAGATEDAGLENTSREDLEKNAIRGLVEERIPVGLDGRANDFAELFYALKEAVRVGRSGEELAEQISQSSLVEIMQKSV